MLTKNLTFEINYVILLLTKLKTGVKNAQNKAFKTKNVTTRY